jgi:hypothetical protein
MVYHRPLDIALAMQLHRGPAFVDETQTEAHVLEAAGDTHPPRLASRRGIQRESVVER